MSKNYPTFKNLVPLFFLLFSFAAFSQTSFDNTPNGTESFTVPPGVTQITVEVWGGGGGGGTSWVNKYSAGGGGGGAHTIAVVGVTPGQLINYIVGSGGPGGWNNTTLLNHQSGVDGESTTFLSVTANGGKGGGGVNTLNVASGGAGGASATVPSGVISYSGGAGSSGSNDMNRDGGGGGSSAGVSSIGTTAGTTAGATAPTGGGNGGNGDLHPLRDGRTPGGGGGGSPDALGVSKAYVGGKGGNGQIIITWCVNPTVAVNADQVITCNNTTAPLDGTGSASGANITYLWSTLDGTFSGGTNAVTATATAAGTYKLTVTNTTTGCSDFKTVAVTKDISLPTVVVNGPIEINCTTTSAALSGTGSATTGVTYAWTASAGGTLSGATDAITATGTTAGTYTLKVTKTATGCFDTKTVTVTRNIPTNTWNGSWSTGSSPTSSQAIEFAADYNSTADLEGCSCQVNAGVKVVFKSVLVEPKSGHTLKITNQVNVLGTGSLTFENNASLVQINDNASNSGNIIYKRTTLEILKTDYIYWSSPVTGATLGAIQTGTLYYSFNAAGNSWVRAYSTTPLAKGIGYIVRGAGTWFDTGNITLTAAFEGAPNNGIVPVTIGAGKNNLIGNPYPSAVDADAFIAANSSVIEGALYFWTHKSAIKLAANITIGTPGSGTYAYTSDDYSPFTKLGGTNSLTGNIAAGQSFFARGSTTGGEAKFNNSMRLGFGGVILNNSNFFKSVSGSKTLPVTATNKIEKNRVWLNLTNTEGAFKQILLGYMTGATNNYDRGYDALSLNGNSFINFYSINNTSLLTIQGRALPIQETDVVPLGYSSTIVGDFSISIDKTDGALSTMAVFLEDKLTNTTHNLKKGAYTFTTEKGTFNDRFVLSYVDKVTLATNDFEVLENGVLITSKNKEININASTNYIDKVFVYDMSGRQIFLKSKIDKNEMTISNLVSGNQVLVVKVLLQNNSIVTKKIIF